MADKKVVGICWICDKYFWKEKLMPIILLEQESAMICENCQKGLDSERGIAVGMDEVEEFNAKYYTE